MKTIYVKQIGSSWTFCDEYGYCVHADGELAYHPDFFDKRPSGYPLYQEAAQHGVHWTENGLAQADGESTLAVVVQYRQGVK